MVVHQSRRNLVDFEIATNRNYDPNWHHDRIAQELEHIEKYGDRDYKILIISVPPRHGKSQMCSIDFPAWYLGKNPHKEVITASYSADLAQDFGGKTRSKVDSDQFKLIFHNVKLKEDEKARGRWRTNGEGSYMAVGVGGPITGRGADILLIDDPIKNREEAESIVMRDKIWDWFTSTAFTRLSPGGVAVIIMTRWHLDDLAGKIIAHPFLSKRTKVIRFAAIAEQDELPFRKKGDPLWLTRYDEKALKEIRDTIGPYDWAALYQGNPVLTENQEFKPGWFRPIDEQTVDMMNCRRFLTVDSAMSKKTQADFTGFCDNRINSENFWHLSAWGAKLGPEELVDTLFTLHAKYKYEKIGLETTTYTQGLKPYLDSEQRKRNVFLPIVELTHGGTAKEIRIRGLIPHYATRSVFHITGRCRELEDQMATFPVGSHDDVLDATAYQLQLVDEEVSGNVTVSYPEE
jgi:hypothetical protein